jgi:hypothetical protein
MRDKTKDWAIGFSFADEKTGQSFDLQYKCALQSPGDSGNNLQYLIFEDQFKNEFSLKEFMKVFEAAGELITYDKRTDVSMNRSVFYGDTRYKIKGRSIKHVYSDGDFCFLASIEIEP